MGLARVGASAQNGGAACRRWSDVALEIIRPFLDHASSSAQALEGVGASGHRHHTQARKDSLLRLQSARNQRICHVAPVEQGILGFRGASTQPVRRNDVQSRYLIKKLSIGMTNEDSVQLLPANLLDIVMCMYLFRGHHPAGLSFLCCSPDV